MIPVLTKEHMAIALEAASAAADAIINQFGKREITAYKGRRDVQLTADILAQEIIIKILSSAYPGYGIIAEEGDFAHWPDQRFVWAIDPLDGTNNFGYGIAHCAQAITLFDQDEVAMALIYDPFTRRGFDQNPDSELAPPRPTPLSRATISLVTGYSESARRWGQRFDRLIDARCKRTLNLWAPALDLALVSRGTIDAMVCRDAALLDVCGGMFMVQSLGGVVLAFSGETMKVSRSLHDEPVSFVASRDPHLASELLEQVQSVETSVLRRAVATVGGLGRRSVG